MIHVTRYERVEIDGIQYMVCAECRRPHMPGYKVCYVVPQPGEANPKDGQSLCRDCYWAQWKRIYPGEPLPKIEETTLQGAKPVEFQGLNLSADAADIVKQKRILDLKQLEDLLEKRKFETEETERMLRELRGPEEMAAVVYRE